MNITNVLSMRFSNTAVADSDAAWDAVTPSIPFTDEYDWILPGGDGEKTVYAQFVTNAGTAAYSTNSAVDGHQPYLDTTAPAATNVQINGGAANATSISVTLTYDFTETVFDAEHKMWAEYRNDGGSWSAKEAVSPGAISKNWILRSEIGTRTVYVRLSDIAGNISSEFSDNIYLDTAAPPVPSPTTATPTNDTTPTWTWTAVPGAVNYRYYFPDYPLIELGNVTSFTPDSPLYDNQDHTFYLQACDAAGNWSDFGFHTVTIDTLPTSVPSPTATTPTNDQSPTWSWNAVSEAVTYRYSYNNSTWTTLGNFTSFTPSSNLPEGTHTLYVQAQDSAGNWSASGSRAVIVDITPPSSPSLSATTPTNDQTPTWSWSAVSGAVTYRYSYNNSTWTTLGNFSSFTPSSSLSEGTHTLYVQAQDSAGNWSASGSRAVIVDITPPASPSLSATTPTNDQTPTWSWSAVSGAVTYRHSYNNSTWTTLGNFTSFTPSSSLSEGTHTLYVQAGDSAGNWSISGSRSVTIDITPPAAPLVSVDPHIVAPVIFSFTSSGATRYRYKLNDSNMTSGATITNTNSATISAGLTVNQSHTLYVQAGDDAGNWSNDIGEATTRSYTWKDTYENSINLGSSLFGGRTTDAVGLGQGGINIPNGYTLKTFGVYLTSGFGSNVSLRLDLRDTSNPGTILKTRTLNLSSSFSGGWIYWTGIDYTATTATSYILTSFMYGASGTNIYSSMRAETSTASNPAGLAYECIGTTDAYMGTWTNWTSKPIAWDFWYRAFGD